MSLKDKLNQVTRRDFLKGVSAVGATAAVYGCGGSGDGGKTYMEEDEENRPTPPSITETTIMSSTPHNCGGRCVSKYYMKDGAIKRIVTDESEETNALGTTANDPQRRSCVRCRSRKQWFYRKDRLLYPLKQTGARGDVNGFVRISWEQAFQEIGQKLHDIAMDPTKGPESLHRIYASADSTGWSSGSVSRLFGMYGSSLGYRNDYSWPALDHVATFVEAQGYIPLGNARGDVVNAEHVFLWSYNGMEAIWGTQSGWYLLQAKERGIPMTAIDTRISMTAGTLADDMVTLAPCTDTALVLGMLYYLLTERYADLDIPFIKAHVHGFFDDPAATSYHASVAAGEYGVPAGASLSAYILGTERYLIDTTGDNLETSIYPDTIGYNVNATDPLFGKRTRIYGQTPKTPEWASAITGIPVAKIKELADTLLDKKCTIWNGSGFQRNTESEQIVWILRILSAVTENFGQSGCSYGMQPWSSQIGGPGNYMGAGVTPIGPTRPTTLASALYDETELTVSSVGAKTNKSSIPVFMWLDAIEYGGTGQSRWNDGQIKNLRTGIKCIFNFAGNILCNQSGDLNLTRQILADKNKCELIVTADHFMTTSAVMSDYVLPATMQMEKPGTSTGWFSEEVVLINQVLEKPGEVKSEFEICTGIAAALGREAEYLGGFEGTEEDRVKKGWDDRYNNGTYPITWAEFKEKGILKGPVRMVIQYDGFYSDPAANPLSTPSGKFEAYCLRMMEDYQARHYSNYDSFGTLENSGTIIDAKNPLGTDSMRFVYPIPMYIPTTEGRHADGSHPDPLGLEDGGLDCSLHTWHIMYRSHSTLNSVAYLNELYKFDRNGNPAFLPESRAADGNGAVTTWEDGVYESVWINPLLAQSKGLQTGNRVKISNGRGSIYASVIVSERVPDKIIFIGQGSWQHKVGDIDVGGCANTLMHTRPSRICQGMTLANDCRVRIEKA
ncbi:dimethyl sulfoxide reductase subunit A [Geovibrio sp. ADMFC3]